MVFTSNVRRGLSLAIPIFSAALFFGILPSVFQIEAAQNLWNTGVTLNTLFGFANLFLWWLVWKHQVP